jgi:anaerobic magnesium-protoporphyrin IX monomethyl ester cyclase
VKRILLINPPETEQSGFTNPPLGLLYIAGTLLKGGLDVRVVDGCLEGKESVRKQLVEFRPHFAGITCLTPGRKKAFEMASLVKETVPGAKVILGGAHATIMHRQIMEHYPLIDYIVLGEGEATCLEIAKGTPSSMIDGLVYRDTEGVIRETGRRKHRENLDDIPFPAWHLVDLRKYPAWTDGSVLSHNGVNLWREPRVSVIFSRGCGGHCSFCSTWWIWKGWRRRSPRNMTGELELLYKEYGIRHFCFADDAMTLDRQATIALCDEIVSRGLKIAFHVTTRTDSVDEEVLRKLKIAGCYAIAYGVESGSETILKGMNKENEVPHARRAIELTRKAGISVTALMIVGNVGETDATIDETIRFLRDTKPDVVGCAGGLWILPGTALYQNCKRIGFIDDDFWLTDEPYKVYTVEKSSDEIKRYCEEITRTVSSPGKTFAAVLAKLLVALGGTLTARTRKHTM